MIRRGFQYWIYLMLNMLECVLKSLDQKKKVCHSSRNAYFNKLHKEGFPRSILLIKMCVFVGLSSVFPWWSSTGEL